MYVVTLAVIMHCHTLSREKSLLKDHCEKKMALKKDHLEKDHSEKRPP